MRFLIQNSLAETRLLLPDRILALDVIGARSLYYTKERFLKSDSEAKSLETYRLIVRVLALARNCFGHR